MFGIIQAKMTRLESSVSDVASLYIYNPRIPYSSHDARILHYPRDGIVSSFVIIFGRRTREVSAPVIFLIKKEGEPDAAGGGREQLDVTTPRSSMKTNASADRFASFINLRVRDFSRAA
jgi:hypothetical protein